MVNLFFVPFAGGSKYSYNIFKKHLPPDIGFHALEFPGRGERLNEPLLYNMDELAEDITAKIFPYRHTPYVLFGHSLGAIVACMAVRRLRTMGANEPLLFFASGNDAPSFCPHIDRMHLKSHNDFMESIKTYGGLPPELFREPALLDFFEPILRADFQVYETYKYKVSEPLSCPAFVLWGMDDHTCSPEGIGAWRQEFSSTVKSLPFEGDHFFIFNHAGEIANLLSVEIRLKEQSLPGKHSDIKSLI